MADYFKEQLVKSGMDIKERVLKIIIGVVISGAILLFIPFISVFIVALAFFLDYKFLRLFSPGFLDREIEYEYTATNSNFEIDKVMNRSNRRHEINLDMKDIICISKLDNRQLLGHSHGAKIKDFSNIRNTNTDDKYAIICMQKDKNGTETKVQVIFEPNEEMLKIFKVFVPKHAVEL